MFCKIYRAFSRTASHVKFLYLIKVESLEVLPQTKSMVESTELFIFAFDYLSKKVNTLLYLDADVVCKAICKIPSYSLI